MPTYAERIAAAADSFRNVDGYTGNPATYYMGSGGATEWFSGLRWQPSAVPRGAIVTAAFITMRAASPSGSTPAPLKIQVYNGSCPVLNAGEPAWNSMVFGAGVGEWSEPGWASTIDFTLSVSSVHLADMLQAWFALNSPGNYLGLRIGVTSIVNSSRVATGYATNPALAPLLSFTWQPPVRSRGIIRRRDRRLRV